MNDNFARTPQDPFGLEVDIDALHLPFFYYKFF